MLGDKVMDLLALCLVFVPVVLFFVLMFTGEKSAYLITVISAVFFLLCTVALIVTPEPVILPVPSLLWRILTLATVSLIFWHSVRDKQLIISVITFIQAVILVVFEIVSLQAEPDNFLAPTLREKLLLLCGTLTILIFMPFVIYLLKKYYSGASFRIKRFGMGILLLLSSFAGLISSNSVTGLFLFWQWQYIAGCLLLKVYGNTYGNAGAKNVFLRTFPYMQQTALTLFLSAGIAAYYITGSMSMQDFRDFGKLSEFLALIIYVTAVLMGLLIPENYVYRFDSAKAVPAAGMYLVIFSLIVPYAVLAKFRPLFHNLTGSVISLMIIYGGILVFAGAYFSLSGYRNRHSILNLIMSMSGLAVATVFKKLQSSIRFLSNNPLPLLLVIAGIVLTAAYIIMWISSIFTAHTGHTSEINEEHPVASIIPFNINFDLIIKIGYITTAALTLGVSLLCMK